MRKEATGYGLLHFVDEMLNQHDKELEGQTVVIPGAGNVATHVAEKAVQMGASVVSLSDSNGTIHDKNGRTQEKIDWVREHKSKSGTSLEAYSDEFDASWHAAA